MPESTRCPICQDTKSSFIQSSHVYLNSVELNLVRCVQCGLVYLNPQPESDEIEGLYSEEYFMQWYSTEEKREFSKEFFRKLLTENDLIKKNTHLNLLDIGCGMGFFLEVAREFGFDAQGVDISPYAAKHCQEKLDFEIRCETLELADYQDDYFDIVTAFDFLEHIRELSGFLTMVKKVLKNEGMFIVLVPNYDSLVFQLDRVICKLKKSPLPNIPEHLTYFTISTLKEILHKKGFKVEKILTIQANDERQFFSFNGSPKAILRSMVDNVFRLLGKISNRREALLAVGKKVC